MDHPTDTEALIDLGNRIRLYRLSKGLTQQQLANMIGSDISLISRVELAKTNPRLTTIAAITIALNISFYDLFKDTPNEIFFDSEIFKSPGNYAGE